MKASRFVPLMLLLALVAPAALLGQDLGDEEKGDHSITHHGFTGLFNVISPDTMARGHVSFGIGHRNYDRELSDADINDLWAGFAIGVTDNVELGMSYVGNRQTDFDDAFTTDFYNNRPQPITTIENGGGDLVAG